VRRNNLRHRGVVFVVLTALVSRPALGCSCGHTPLEQVYSEADAVFEGRVQSVSHRYLQYAWLMIRGLVGAPDPDDSYSNYGIRVKFEVMKSWKGTQLRHLTVLTGRGGGDCGVDFRNASDYLVFGYATKNGDARNLIATDCTTKLLTQGARELSFLRALPSAEAGPKKDSRAPVLPVISGRCTTQSVRRELAIRASSAPISSQTSAAARDARHAVLGSSTEDKDAVAENKETRQGVAGIRVFEAVYEDGVLKPLEDPGLPEHQRFFVRVQELGEKRADDELAAWQRVYAGLPEEDVAAVEEIALDRSRFFRRQPE
jgi:predicted DNA-binding antitoxin AbrB/MazE fold protein